MNGDAPRPKSGRIRLVIAFALFAGWVGWLGYTTAVKSRAPVVSRSQAAATGLAVWAEVSSGPDGKPAERAKVTDAPLKGVPPVGGEIDVANLPAAGGYAGPGKYLLLLATDRGPLRVADELQRSPGYEISGRPVIYPWSPEVEAQAKALFR